MQLSMSSSGFPAQTGSYTFTSKKGSRDKTFQEHITSESCSTTLRFSPSPSPLGDPQIQQKKLLRP